MLQLAVQRNNTDKKQPGINLCVCVQTEVSSHFDVVSLPGSQDLHLAESASCTLQRHFFVSRAQDLLHNVYLYLQYKAMRSSSQPWPKLEGRRRVSFLVLSYS